MLQITEMEEKLMRAIPRQDFYEDGFNSELWTDCLIDDLATTEGITTKQSRALLTTLNRKGFILVSDTGRDGGVTLRADGMQWLVENGIVDPITGYRKK